MALPSRPRSAALAHVEALDGLRGVGVAAVLLFHGTTSAPGGYLGVDLFFVLSGFLITTLLVRERASTGGIDLVAFWARRARRLLPAMLLVVAAVVAMASAGALEAGEALRGDAVATLTYWANWRFVAEGTDYFAAFRAPSPLQHAWSLAIEEQWYLVWPPIVMLVLPRLSRRAVVIGVAGLAVASALAMVALSGDATRAYYGTDARVQALLVGALAALLVDRRPVTDGRSGRTVALAGAVAAIPVAAMLWQADGSATWMYRGGFSAFALLSAVVVVAATVPGGPVARALRLPPLTALGRISYGLYLWHWPLNLWLTPDRTGLGGWPLFAVRTGAALVVATTSYHLVEQPIRTGRRIARRPVAVAAVAVALVVGAITLPLPETVIGPSTPSGQSSAAAQAFEDFSPPDDEPAVPASALDTAARPLRGDRPARILVVGDSVGWTLSQWLGPVEGATVMTGSLIGCGAHPAPIRVGDRVVELEGEGGASCDGAAAFWAARVAAESPDVVVLMLGAWEVYDREDPALGRLDVGSPGWHDWMVDGLEDVAARLARQTPARIVIPEVPCFAEDELQLGTSAAARNDAGRVAAVNRAIDDLVARHPDRLARVPMRAWLCVGDAAIDERDGVELRPDGVHFDPASARLTWEQWLIPRLEDL
jgi:peptidoglycan/LPS O-acetylase OafA/YrhL